MLTDYDRHVRHGRIGASEAPALLGYSPWCKPAEAIEKWVERHQPGYVAPVWPAADRGNRYEGAIFTAYLDRMEGEEPPIVDDSHPRTEVHPSHDWLCATPDRRLADRIVQIKFVDSVDSRRKWKEGVPEYVACQVACELAVAHAVWGITRCDVVADLGGTTMLGTSVFPLYRDEALEREILAALESIYRTELEPRLRALKETAHV